MSTITTTWHRGLHAAAQASLCVAPSVVVARGIAATSLAQGTRGMADRKAGVFAVPTFGPGSCTWSPPPR